MAKETKASKAREALNNCLSWYSTPSEADLDAISQNAYCSRKYAERVGRFEKGEKIIATSAKQSFLYAKNAIHKRFALGEDVIAEDPKYALAYANEVIRGPWAKGEDSISQDAESSFEYAAYVLNGRFYKGEPEILKDSWVALKYAQKIIEGEWPEAEEIISKCSKSSLEYARLINCRFEKGEKSLLKEPNDAVLYAIDIGQRFEEAEDKILNNVSDYLLFRYVEKAIKGRWIKFEERLLRDNNYYNDYDLSSYATSLAESGAEVPEEIHNRVLAQGMIDKEFAEDYLDAKKNSEIRKKLDLVKHLSFEELEKIINNNQVLV